MTFNNKSIAMFMSMSYLTSGPNVVSASSLRLIRYHVKVGVPYPKNESEVPSILSSIIIKIGASLTGALNEPSNFFDEYNKELCSEAYGTWDTSMSLSMSMSMPSSPSIVEYVGHDPLTLPPSIVKDPTKDTPTYYPGIRKSQEPTSSLLSYTTMNPSFDDVVLWNKTTETNLITLDKKNEKFLTKLTPVGVTFMSLSLIAVVGTIVGMLVVHRRRRQQRGQRELRSSSVASLSIMSSSYAGASI